MDILRKDILGVNVVVAFIALIFVLVSLFVENGLVTNSLWLLFMVTTMIDIWYKYKTHYLARLNDLLLIAIIMIVYFI